MQKIEEIREKNEKIFSSEAQENLAPKEIQRYFKKKRFLFPTILVIISILVFSFLEDILSIFGKEFSDMSKEISLKIVFIIVASLVVTVFALRIYISIKKSRGEYNEWIEQEKISLIKKDLKERKKEIERLEKEKNNLDEYIIELKTEKNVIESMI